MSWEKDCRLESKMLQGENASRRQENEYDTPSTDYPGIPGAMYLYHLIMPHFRAL